jgi:hypothetical protein
MANCEWIDSFVAIDWAVPKRVAGDGLALLDHESLEFRVRRGRRRCIRKIVASTSRSPRSVAEMLTVPWTCRHVPVRIIATALPPPLFAGESWVTLTLFPIA